MDDLSEKKKRLRRFRDAEKTDNTVKIAGFRIHRRRFLRKNVKAVYSVKKVTRTIQRRKDYSGISDREKTG